MSFYALNNMCLQNNMLKGPYLGSNLLSDKASHKGKRMCKISFLDDIRFLSYVKLKPCCSLHLTCCRRRMNEPLLTIL